MRVAGVLLATFSIFTAGLTPLHAFASTNISEEQKLREYFAQAYPGQSERVQALRQEINQNAYLVTMRLCAGYRHMFDRGNFLVAKQSLPVPIRDAKLRDSLQAWQKLFAEGFFSFWQSFYGTKAFHSELRQLEWYEPSSFVGSVYIYYLFRSSGFMKASVHCLGFDKKTGAPKTTAMNNFATAIATADGLGNLVAQLGTGIAAGKLASYTLHGFRYISGFMPRVWGKTIKWSLVATAGTGAAYFSYDFIIRLNAAAKLARSLDEKLQEESAENALGDLQTKTFLQLRQTRLARIVLAFEKMQRNRSLAAEARTKQRQEFTELLRVTLQPHWTAYKDDYQKLQQKKQLNEKELQYRRLLAFTFHHLAPLLNR